MNDKQLRILFVEDAPPDAELCQRELARGGLKFIARRVDTRESFEEALRAFRPDIVLSDFSMPTAFDGMTALDLTRQHSADLPFVFVSGTIGEDRAVEAMRRGATDYVLKDRLHRLAPVIQRALREAEERSARRRTERELAETRSRLDGIVSSLPDVVWSYSLRERRLRYVSPAANTVFGLPEANLYADPAAWMNLIHPEDRERVARERRQSLRTGRLDSIYRVVVAGGEVRWIHDRGAVSAGEEGALVHIDGLARDVTDLKLQEQRIARLSRIQAVLTGINAAQARIRDRRRLFEEACRIAVEHGGFALAWIGAPDQERGTLVPVAWAGPEADSFFAEVSAAAPGGEPLGDGIVGRAVRERRAVYRNDIAAEATRGGARRQQAVRRGYRSAIALPLIVEGAVVATLSLFAREPDYFDDGEVMLLTDLAEDVNFALDHIAKEEKLDYLAYYDVLTGLPNRAHFSVQLDQRLGAARREQQTVGVIMLDVERFRSVNETLGRKAGDELLRLLASRLRGALGEADILAHLGGDYFAVATRPAEQAEAFARLLDETLASVAATPFTPGGSELRIAARAGVAIFPGDGVDAESLLRNAEAALKDSKRTGQRYLFYAPQMNALVAEQLRLENDLRRAVAEEQFVLYYQPRVELAGRTLSGFEALIRWVHPARGLIAPGEFIPLLESTGLILDVGRWALRRAALDRAAWIAAGLEPPRIAVNVSAIQLRRVEFVDDVWAALTDIGGFQHLDIEITESMLMDDVEGNTEKLKALREMGMQVALDDFGTGYCSLSYLSRLPIDSLKVDRSFVSRMTQGAAHMAIVSAIVSLAHALDVKVCAEGVEQQEQASLLRLLRCNEAQGYLFARPEPLDAAALRIGRGQEWQAR